MASNSSASGGVRPVGTSDIQSTIRNEMRQVLVEMSENSRKEEEGTSMRRLTTGTSSGGAVTGTRPPNEIMILKERISTLEDVLAKSEADRCAIYAKHEASVRALNAANEEKTAMMHEYHDNTMGQEALTSARQEVDQVRAQTKQMAEHYELQIAQLNDELHHKDRLISKLKKTVKEKEDKTDGVSLADLHFSNERLSAQLSKIQAPSQSTPQDEQKVAACVSAVSTLNNEVLALEQRLKQQVANQAMERQQLLDRIDTQRRDYDNERTECDRVFSIVNAKLEALVSENNFLRSQMNTMQQTMQQQQQQQQAAAAEKTAAESPRVGGRPSAARRLYH